EGMKWRLALQRAWRANTEVICRKSAVLRNSHGHHRSKELDNATSTAIPPLPRHNRPQQAEIPVRVGLLHSGYRRSLLTAFCVVSVCAIDRDARADRG